MPPTHPPAMWKKFELFAKKKWMVSLDNDNILTEIQEIAPEIKMIKKLAKCDSKNTKIYLQFNQRIQNKIQSAIEDALEYKTINPYRTPSLGDLSIDNICYDFFGIMTFETQLMIWEDLNGKGIIRVWNTTPTMINDRVMTFPACIVSSPSTDVKIIEDTQQLLTETCIPNGELLGNGYCRKYMDTENVIIPFALIRMIIRYFNVDFKTLNKYWISKE